MSRALVAVPIAVVLLAYGSSALDRQYDYDEVAQAHTIWLIAQGQVPYRDFFECHPPFLWYAFLPVLAVLPDGPPMLVGLRFLSVIGCVAWLAALFTAARTARPSLRSEWLVLAAAIAASHPLVLYYGSQFRPDIWVWAAACAVLARAIRMRPGLRRAVELGAAGTLCALALPKLAPLFPAYVGVDLLRRARDPVVGREIAGYALGITAAVGMAIGFTLAVGVDPREAWDLSMRYHRYIAMHYGAAYGLWREVVTDLPSFVATWVGLLAWVAWLRSRRATPTTFELAILITIGVQLWLVPFPYVQYSAPVYGFSAIFLPYCGEWAAALGERRRRAPALVLACACTVSVWIAMRPLAAGWRSGEAERLAAIQRKVLELAPSESTILVPPPFHPIVRRDAIYALLHTDVPSGLTTEKVLRRLRLKNHERTGQTAVRRSLEQNRPAVILFPDHPATFYSGEKATAIAGYLADHASQYQRVAGIAPTLWVRADLVQIPRSE